MISLIFNFSDSVGNDINDINNNIDNGDSNVTDVRDGIDDKSIHLRNRSNDIDDISVIDNDMNKNLIESNMEKVSMVWALKLMMILMRFYLLTRIV